MTTQHIGAAIRKARGARSIRQVAAAAGLHRDQVKAIEEARTNYTIGSLLALCREVGVELRVM